ncbi:hypothetical protein [Actinoplanes subtropicus]|uniref:hypothetical protein n=1 Tax=Actinoplanes subtropicus TaxID=543632 RepID=UPI0004C36203|nr:hypothetical protein [Actinoplanes subtropicus]
MTRTDRSQLASEGRVAVVDSWQDRATRAALGAAVLGFFAITHDASVVNSVLAAIREDLGGGMSGLQPHSSANGYTNLTDDLGEGWRRRAGDGEREPG